MTVDPTVIEQIEEAIRESVLQGRTELVQGRFREASELAAACAAWCESLTYLEELGG